jgi:putrescine importer
MEAHVAILGVTLLLANVGSGMGAQNRRRPTFVWHGTQQRALPRSSFGVVDSKHHVLRNSLSYVAGTTLIGAFVISYGLGAEMLTFGSLIAFMG